MNIVLPGVFLIPLLLRGLFVWLLLRAGFSFLAWLISGAEEPIVVPLSGLFGPVPWQAALWLVLVVTAAGMLELRRRNEHLLFANFGVRQWVLALLCAMPAAIGEMVIMWGLPAPA